MWYAFTPTHQFLGERGYVAIVVKVCQDRIMQVDIFIRSWHGDFNWLEYCLRSIKKYAHGFGKVHICIPSDDITMLPAGSEEVHLVNRWSDDYIGQQNDKLHCDMYCNAPYVLCMDSDCVLTRDLRPEDLFMQGNPIWLYEAVPHNQSPWYPITEEALGWMPEFEFMRRHPFVFSRSALRDFRAFMFNRHGESLSNWLKKRPKGRFSEFNAFGAWAYRNYHEHFAWMTPEEVPCYVMQKWSWGGLNDEIKKEFEALLA